MAAAGRTARILGAVAAFAAMAYPSFLVHLLAVREAYRLCELVGIMDPAGALGGQVAGFNFQREPAWAHWAAWGLAGVVGFGPGLVLALAIATPGVIGVGPTICGRCGRSFRGASEARCPRCGGEFS